MTDQQTIYIESDEEITSVVDKIKTAIGHDLALVIPRGSLINQSLLNLKLILKTTEEAGKNLGVVTSDTVGRQLAHRVGLTVYESAESRVIVAPPPAEFQKKSVATTGEQDSETAINIHHFQTDTVQPETTLMADHQMSYKPVKTKKLFKLLLKLLSPLVVVFGIYLLLAPKAVVTLTVAGEPIERELSITIDPQAATISSDGLLMPGELVEVIAETTQQFPATGKKNVGQKSAGKVTISNRTGEDVSLAVGSRLKSSDNLIYLTAQAVVVKAAVPKIDVSGNLSAAPGQATVEVTAEEPGEKYNVSTTTTFILLDLPSSKQDKVTVETTSLIGGSTAEVTVVSQEDIDNGQKTTLTNLENELKNQAIKKTNNKTILDGALTTEVTDRQIDRNAGDEGPQVTIKLKGRAKAIAFSESVFKQSLAQLVRRNLPEDKDINPSDNDEIAMTTQSIDFEQKKLVVRGTLKTQIIPKFNQPLIKKQLAGVTISRSQVLIKALPQVKSSDLKIWPDWYRRLPFLSSRISINIQHD